MLTENQLDVHSLICLFRSIGSSSPLKGTMGFPCGSVTQKVLQESNCLTIVNIPSQTELNLETPHHY